MKRLLLAILLAFLPVTLHAQVMDANGYELNACRLSDGTNYYNTVLASQLPASLDGSGFLKVTANAGTNLNTSLLALSAPQTDRTQKSQITDGTRDGTVKAASTAAVATDTAVVVAISPNNTIAATQSGTWTDRIVGNAGGIVDAANNATASANQIQIGDELQSGAQATAGTAGQVGRVVAGLDHVQYARLGGPVYWQCGLTAIAATLTQCKAAPAAGLKSYVTDITIVSDTTAAGQFTLRYGTGTNCATGATTLYPFVAATTTGKWPYPANTALQPNFWHFFTPLQPAAANAVCVICVATNTCTISMQGFDAP